MTNAPTTPDLEAIVAAAIEAAMLNMTRPHQAAGDLAKVAIRALADIADESVVALVDEFGDAMETFGSWLDHAPADITRDTTEARTALLAAVSSLSARVVPDEEAELEMRRTAISAASGVVYERVRPGVRTSDPWAWSEELASDCIAAYEAALTPATEVANDES